MTDIDLGNYNDDELEVLMKRIAIAKQRKEKRTPEPSSPPLMRGNHTPETYVEESTNYNHRDRDESVNYRPDPVEYVDNSYTRDHYTKDKITTIEDSDSDDLESLESFINQNLRPELSNEEWLFVSALSHKTDQSRKCKVSDWLNIGSEDQFDDMPDYKPTRRTGILYYKNI
ncbi:hypothetical protein LOD99_10111 [Oopsacas minuta]|uniref:Uncharacterized protein n=1 Tax=Oopsacas minuta TaxID=111878 RepID=A0AAV7KPB5_9METZ|nr:hypothetical protein LOD99_10111 [Oopsacas minuta]